MAEHTIICPNCHNANEYGDYEGPTCEVCLGDGFVPSIVDTGDELHQVLAEALAMLPSQDGGQDAGAK